MASQLLSAMREDRGLSPPDYSLPFFHELEMWAHGADLRCQLPQAISECMDVEITINHIDSYQTTVADPNTGALSVEEEPQGDMYPWSFSFQVPICPLTSTDWPEKVFQMLRQFFLSPESRLRVLQAMPCFLHDAVRKACEGGFRKLVVVADVWQKVRDAVYDASSSSEDDDPYEYDYDYDYVEDDDHGDGEAEESDLFYAAMAWGAIRKVQAKEGGMCAICHEEFLDDGKEVSELCCSHVFHSGCISKWFHVSCTRLLQSSRCPICRHVLVE